MTLTYTERCLLDARDTALVDEERKLIELTFQDLYYRASQANMPMAKDDRAAKLEAAMVRFLLDSRPLQLVKGFHTLRNVLEKGDMETLYIVRLDGSVACSAEHPYDPTNFSGSWPWRERTDLSAENVSYIAEFIGNYPDPTR
jgi:hypothetical protein